MNYIKYGISGNKLKLKTWTLILRKEGIFDAKFIVKNKHLIGVYFNCEKDGSFSKITDILTEFICEYYIDGFSMVFD